MKLSIPGFVYAKGTSHYDAKIKKMVDSPAFVFAESGELAGAKYCEDMVLAGTAEVIAEVPDSFDPRSALVKNLEAQKKRLMAEFNARVVEIDAQIQTYLAIEA